MAAPASKLTVFSLAGYLELRQKKNLFKNAYRRYWFWFDEQTCCLKYYRSQETYTLGVNEPLGTIDLRYAKVTPGITAGSTASNVFHINANGQTHILAAADGNKALSWITSLQEKRGDFIKVSSALEETALEQEKDKRQLKPPGSNPVGALAETHEDTDPATRSPTTVRKIVRSKLSRGSMALELVSNPPNHDPGRRATYDPLSDAGPQQLPQPRSCSRLPITPERDVEEEEEEECKDYTNFIFATSPPVTFTPRITSELSVASPLTPADRKVLELESACLNYQSQVDRLQKEVLRLKERVENRDTAILDLNMEMSLLREELAKMNKPQSDLQLEIGSLKDIISQYKRSLKSLDDEVELHKLNQKEHDRRINAEKQKGVEMEKELNMMKSKYIMMLSKRFKIRIPTRSSGQEDSVEDIELTHYTNELLSLLELEGGENLYRGSFEDQYGDTHDWQSDVITHHYLCRQLYLHYNQQEVESNVRDWEDFIGQIKRTRKPYLDLIGGGDRSKKEVRSMLRKGVPYQFRMMVWQSLVFRQVGRLKEVRDAAAEGGSYYWSLVRAKGKVTDEKQIKVDLHRTLPNNKYFKLNGSGIPKLENILLAFSRHNRNVGYCQGMNMVAALGLLFLDEETVFWYMVAIIEKLLPPDYYTINLVGVKADQLVMGDLVREKLPILQAHLDDHGIDINCVTINWFLTLFVDPMPTESALRVMDCFLLEGPKFLFRTSLSILRMNQSLIIKQKDTFVLLQILKELAKHMFDVEALFQEFSKLAPFPNRTQLGNRHQAHLVKVKTEVEELARLKAKKEQQRDHERVKLQSMLHLGTSFTAKDVPAPVQRLVWECGCVCGEGERQEVWLCSGDGKLGVVSTSGDIRHRVSSCEIIPRVICTHYLPGANQVLLGTLDFNLAAIDCSTKVEKWRRTLSDSILGITASGNKVFVALADGLVAMLNDVSESSLEPLLLRVGSTAVSSVLLCGPGLKYLWCGCGKSIIVMCTETLEPVESLVALDRVNKLVGSEMGVWVSFRSSSMLTLYDSQHCVPLLSLDYYSILPQEQRLSEEDVQRSHHRITSLNISADQLWVGTGGGHVLAFACRQNVSNPSDIIRKLAKQKAVATEATPSSKNTDGGGLLSTSRKAAAETPDEEKWVDVGGLGSESSTPTHYQKRRKTQFGKTLRNRSHKNHQVQGLPDVYSLQFLTAGRMITAATDSVRVLLPFRSDCEGQETVSHMISCVSTAKTDWKEGVQLWTCDNSEPPDKWSFRFLTPGIDARVPRPIAESAPKNPDQ